MSFAAAKKKAPVRHTSTHSKSVAKTSSKAAASRSSARASSKRSYGRRAKYQAHTSRSHRTKYQARRTYQTQPTPERYKEIQQALAGKGYFKGDVNGQWGPDSVDALRRFQSDQNLDPDGKIGALSLIALGLGPKRMTAQVQPGQQTAPANQPTENKQEQP